MHVENSVWLWDNHLMFPAFLSVLFCVQLAPAYKKNCTSSVTQWRLLLSSVACVHPSPPLKQIGESLAPICLRWGSGCTCIRYILWDFHTNQLRTVERYRSPTVTSSYPPVGPFQAHVLTGISRGLFFSSNIHHLPCVNKVRPTTHVVGRKSQTTLFVIPEALSQSYSPHWLKYRYCLCNQPVKAGLFGFIFTVTEIWIVHMRKID